MIRVRDGVEFLSMGLMKDSRESKEVPCHLNHVRIQEMEEIKNQEIKLGVRKWSTDKTLYQCLGFVLPSSIQIIKMLTCMLLCQKS